VFCCANNIEQCIIIFRSVASSRKKSKKVQYVTKKEDLNKMRLSRYKMERYGHLCVCVCVCVRERESVVLLFI
jgi:hypothetical protein